MTKSTASSVGVKKLDLTSEKLGKSIDRNATTLVSRHNTSRTDYCGNVVYEDSVCRLLFPQGYFTFDETTGKAVPHYFLKDHLGSVRVVMAADGTAEQVNHYYAFGGLLGDSSGGDVQKYKYNGKELDRFLNWDMLDYGARWMDGKLQQWPTVDPLAEKDPGISPYVYCKNDPVNYIDPTGMDYWYTNDPEQIRRFMESRNMGGDNDYTSWTHVSDDDFMANLSYNDETRNYIFSHGSYEDGGFVCTAHVFRPLSDPLDVLSMTNTFFDQFGNSLKKNAGNSTIDSNGKFHWAGEGEPGFYGNQYVRAVKLKSIGMGITKVTGKIGGLIDFIHISEGYEKDGGSIGYNTIHATAEVGGGWAGGVAGGFAGAKIGAVVGAWACGFGAIPCAIIGGAIGGFAGAIGGGSASGSLVDYFYSMEE